MNPTKIAGAWPELGAKGVGIQGVLEQPQGRRLHGKRGQTALGNQRGRSQRRLGLLAAGTEAKRSTSQG